MVVESVQLAIVCECYNVVEELNVCTTADVSQPIICMDNCSRLDKKEKKYGKGKLLCYLIKVAQREGYPIVYSVLITFRKGNKDAVHLISSLRLYSNIDGLI